MVHADMGIEDIDYPATPTFWNDDRLYDLIHRAASGHKPLADGGTIQQCAHCERLVWLEANLRGEAFTGLMVLLTLVIQFYFRRAPPDGK